MMMIPDDDDDDDIDLQGYRGFAENNGQNQPRPR